MAGRASILVFTAVVAVLPAGAHAWSIPQLISPDSEAVRLHNSRPRVAATSSGSAVVVWTSQDADGTTTPYRRRSSVRLTRSSDGGGTWTLPIQLSAPGELATEPALATDQAGNWAILWNSGDFLSEYRLGFARSSDEGGTWSLTAATGAQAPGHTGYFCPSLAAGQALDSWVSLAAAWNTESTASSGLKLIAARSSGSPANWNSTGAESADDVAGSDGNAWLPQVACDGEGNCVTVAVASPLTTTSLPFGYASLPSRLVVSHSSNDGLTWSPAVPVSPADETTGTEIFPHLATDGQGTWIAAWLKAPPAPSATDYYVAFSRSTDDGATWSSPVRLFVDTASFATPWNAQPRISADGTGRWVVVLERGGSIGYVFSRDSGQSWSNAVVLDPDASEAGETLAYAPDIACSGPGRWIAVWESIGIASSAGEPSTIMATFLEVPAPTAARDWTLY